MRLKMDVILDALLLGVPFPTPLYLSVTTLHLRNRHTLKVYC